MRATGEARDGETFAALVAVQVLFGSLAVAGKFAFASFEPRVLAALRTAGAAVLLFAIAVAFAKDTAGGPWRARGKLPRLAVLSFFGVIVNQILFLEGLARTTAVSAVMLVSTIPVFTLGIAWATGVERLDARKAAGVVVALAGVGILLGGEIRGVGDGDAVGDLLVVANSLSYSVYLVLARPVLRAESPLGVNAWTFVFGAIGISAVAAPGLLDLAWGDVTPAGWAALAYVILFGTVAAYGLNTWVLARWDAGIVASYIFLQPLFGALFAILLLSETLTWNVLAGGAGIVVGVLLVTRARPGPAERAVGRDPRLE
ncbi:MAG: DMT family transporter [Methanobacteriota archaeon]